MLTRAGLKFFSTNSLKVVNNVAKQQFTVTLAETDAAIGYEERGQNITFIRTDVPPEFQGKGVGRLLAKHAFDHALKNNLDVTCKCHFLARYYENHRNDYKGLNIKFELEDEKK